MTYKEALERVYSRCCFALTDYEERRNNSNKEDKVLADIGRYLYEDIRELVRDIKDFERTKEER